MEHHKYYVVFHDGQWKVSYDGTRYGPYDTQREAYRDAVDVAKKEGDKGHRAQVFIQLKENESEPGGRMAVTRIHRPDEQLDLNAPLTSLWQKPG